MPSITEMSDDEIQAEIRKLQQTQVPSERKAKQPRRIGEPSDKPKRRTWRDELD